MSSYKLGRVERGKVRNEKSCRPEVSKVSLIRNVLPPLLLAHHFSSPFPNSYSKTKANNSASVKDIALDPPHCCCLHSLKSLKRGDSSFHHVSRHLDKSLGDFITHVDCSSTAWPLHCYPCHFLDLINQCYTCRESLSLTPHFWMPTSCLPAHIICHVHINNPWPNEELQSPGFANLLLSIISIIASLSSSPGGLPQYTS